MNVRSACPMLSIAIVTETYPPEVNGVANTIARVVDGLRARGHRLLLVRPRQQVDQSELRAEGLEELLVGGRAIPLYPHLRMGLPCTDTLRQRWQSQRPDLVYLVTEGPLGWSALKAAESLGIPTVSEFRTNFHAYSRHYGLGLLKQPIMAYLRRFHNRTGATMVPTTSLRDALAAEGVKGLQVVARGIDTQRFHPSRRSKVLRALWGAEPDDPVVACVTRLAPEKNLGQLMSAFESVKAVLPRARLVLVGDGPARAGLLKRCPNAIFAGQRSGDDLATHYASADLFIFPSQTETFGNVTLEAMASGLAVLAFDHAAAGELIRDGENGRIVPCEDARGFEDAAVWLASRPTHARAMGFAARRTAETLDWARIIDHVEAVIASVLQTAPQGAARNAAIERVLA